jgi:hypothetical protein
LLLLAQKLTSLFAKRKIICVYYTSIKFLQQQWITKKASLCKNRLRFFEFDHTSLERSNKNVFSSDSVKGDVYLIEPPLFEYFLSRRKSASK